MLERSFAHEELRALKWRLPLNDDFENYLSRLERGFHGENEFSKKLADYNEYAHVYDFTFEIDGSTRRKLMRFYSLIMSVCFLKLKIT
ncbi:hypothetical protein [Nosocomiicoccus ampullae]|uniref:Uncharacterized protein n=1 Tax=Nosocomiicoccus ampullae TaxID=489910 RepID=A0A9Q2HF84_9STAP|nr:hypothetical protein [Nosocomiicoccus ampullae]MBB5175974.1 hypothetical protein [Nosocomiicoccus ampullae]QYA46696.1 hypothetical protein KPF49_07015 [Nosocomiicoccus ampullae]